MVYGKVGANGISNESVRPLENIGPSSYLKNNLETLICIKKIVDMNKAFEPTRPPPPIEMKLYLRGCYIAVKNLKKIRRKKKTGGGGGAK